jgi:hypothetical protein
VAPPFDDVVHIDDADITSTCCRRGESWNILTRVQYHKRSPYALTLQVDSDRVVCGDVSRLFELLEVGGWDFLSTSAGLLPVMDHGVIGMRHGPPLTALLTAWADKMVELGHEGRDEQTALALVRGTIPGLRTGFLAPSWQMKYAPAGGAGNEACAAAGLAACNMTHSLVMHGPVRIAAAELPTMEAQSSLCGWLNAEPARPRVFVADLLRARSYAVAHTPRECDALTRGQCGHPEVRWEPLPAEVLPVDAYLALFNRNSSSASPATAQSVAAVPPMAAAKTEHTTSL